MCLLVLGTGFLEAQTIYWKKDHIYNSPGGKEIAVVVPAPSDQTAPNAPTSLSSSATTATTVTLSWTVSTSSDVVGQKIYRKPGTGANLPVGTVGSGVTGFTDQPLQPSTSYSYTVVAYDNAQNHSSASNTVNVTTRMADIARAIGRDRAELAETFRLPHDAGDETLLGCARAFASNAVPVADIFVAHELPPTFLKELEAAIARFEELANTTLNCAGFRSSQQRHSPMPGGRRWMP